MTTRTTTIQANRKGARALIGAAAASLAVLGGVLLWQARPTSETTAPPTATVGTYNEGVAPMGGLAERYTAERAEARAEVARLERMGGLAELYRDRAVVTDAVPPTGVVALTDGAGHYVTEPAAATTAAVPGATVRTNGMAELGGAPPAAPATTARGTTGDCGATVGPAAC